MYGLRALRAGQGADGLDDGDEDREVCAVFVGRVVGVHEARLRGGEDGREVGYEARIGAVLHHAARVVELEHGGVAPERGGRALLLAAHGHHLRIGEIREFPLPRAARAIRAGHAAEPLRGALVTRGDAVKGHEFQVILMRANAEVRDAREGVGRRESIGDENVGGGIVERHQAGVGQCSVFSVRSPRRD